MKAQQSSTEAVTGDCTQLKTLQPFALLDPEKTDAITDKLIDPGEVPAKTKETSGYIDVPMKMEFDEEHIPAAMNKPSDIDTHTVLPAHYLSINQIQGRKKRGAPFNVLRAIPGVY